MRMFLAGCVLLVSGAVLLAVDILDRPLGPPIPEEEAEQFTRQLYQTLEQVSSLYVRPVTHGELAAAALHGMYEAARVPVPASLEAEARTAISDQVLVALILRTRLALGNPEPLQGTNALLAAVQGMTRALDPYSAVISGAEMYANVDEGPNFGLEVADNLSAGPVLIRTVVPGGPAQRAGLRPGDRITHFDGKPVAEVASAAALLDPSLRIVVTQGEFVRPDRVALTVARPEEKETRKLTLEARPFRRESVLGVVRRDDNSWDYWFDREHKIAQVRLGGLIDGTAEELDAVLTGLQAQGLRGLLLDLRWCPGGFLTQSIVAARMFVGNRPVAVVQGRDGEKTEFTERPEHEFLDLPLVVMVNGETSGGAELIAAALQDHGRARVLGQRTLGKASVQKSLPLGIPNMGLKLTRGTFLRPSGKNLHRHPDSKPADDWGVLPDEGLEARVSGDLSRQLREWWLLQTLRPGGSRDPLPLDDPTSDPPRQAALEVMRAMVK